MTEGVHPCHLRHVQVSHVLEWCAFPTVTIWQPPRCLERELFVLLVRAPSILDNPLQLSLSRGYLALVSVILIIIAEIKVFIVILRLIFRGTSTPAPLIHMHYDFLSGGGHLLLECRVAHRVKSPQRFIVHLATHVRNVDRELLFKLAHLHLGQAFLLVELSLILEHLMNVREVHIDGLDGLCKFAEAEAGVRVGIKPAEDRINPCLGRLLFFPAVFGIIL